MLGHSWPKSLQYTTSNQPRSQGNAASRSPILCIEYWARRLWNRGWPVKDAWPERGGSAIKIIKRRSQSLMKSDLLNAFMHISITMVLHYILKKHLLWLAEFLNNTNVTEKFQNYFLSINATSASAQTEVVVDVDLSYENCSPSELESALELRIIVLNCVWW